jgi:TonB family protein
MQISRTGAVLAALTGVLMLSGTSACLADSLAKIDQNKAALTADYPGDAQVQGEQGDVLLDVEVGTNGRPQRIRLDKSSGYTDLDDAALQTAANFHYVPAVSGGDTETTWKKIVIRYQLPQAPR